MVCDGRVGGMRGGENDPMAAAAQHKIVIVEDEGLIAADLESRLKSSGYQVPGTADSAQPALKLIRESSPDLVLMDIRLKGEQDGIQVAQVLREQFDIPVVYLTAYEDRATLDGLPGRKPMGT